MLYIFIISKDCVFTASSFNGGLEDSSVPSSDIRLVNQIRQIKIGR